MITEKEDKLKHRKEEKMRRDLVLKKQLEMKKVTDELFALSVETKVLIGEINKLSALINEFLSVTEIDRDSDKIDIIFRGKLEELNNCKKKILAISAMPVELQKIQEVITSLIAAKEKLDEAITINKLQREALPRAKAAADYRAQDSNFNIETFRYSERRNLSCVNSSMLFQMPRRVGLTATVGYILGNEDARKIVFVKT